MTDELVTLISRTPDETYAELCAIACQSVAASSARIYQQTYAAWHNFCHAHKLMALHLHPSLVQRFLSQQVTTKATRQRQLSALRTLARTLYVLAPADDTRRLWEGLKLLKAPQPQAPLSERHKRALAPHEAERLLWAWQETSLMHQRNRALIAVLLLAGIRRSEAANLRWQDVDFIHGTLTIRHGKGDKERIVPLAGDWALEALRIWQARQGTGRNYIFCPVERGDHLGKDKPLRGTDIYVLVEQSAQQVDLDIKPHDLRRTLITEALSTGTPLTTVQAIAGHANPATTLRYAQALEARAARQQLRLRYAQTPPSTSHSPADDT